MSSDDPNYEPSIRPGPPSDRKVAEVHVSEKGVLGPGVQSHGADTAAPRVPDRSNATSLGEAITSVTPMAAIVPTIGHLPSHNNPARSQEAIVDAIPASSKLE